MEPADDPDNGDDGGLTGGSKPTDSTLKPGRFCIGPSMYSLSSSSTD